jgi:hypothetical protein
MSPSGRAKAGDMGVDHIATGEWKT